MQHEKYPTSHFPLHLMKKGILLHIVIVRWKLLVASLIWLPAWWALWLLWWPLTDAAMFQCFYGYVSMCLRICFNVFTDMFQCVYGYVSMCLRICFNVFTDMFQCVYGYVSMCLRICFNVFTDMFQCVYGYVSMCLRICFNVYTGIVRLLYSAGNKIYYYYYINGGKQPTNPTNKSLDQHSGSRISWHVPGVHLAQKIACSWLHNQRRMTLHYYPVFVFVKYVH